MINPTTFKYFNGFYSDEVAHMKNANHYEVWMFPAPWERRWRSSWRAEPPC